MIWVVKTYLTIGFLLAVYSLYLEKKMEGEVTAENVISAAIGIFVWLPVMTYYLIDAYREYRRTKQEREELMNFIRAAIEKAEEELSEELTEEEKKEEEKEEN